MDTLPSEVLEHICSAMCATHRPSIFQFSLVDERIRSIAFRFLVEEVRFFTMGRMRLSMDVDRWNELLTHYHAFQYVRRVKVDGAMPFKQYDQDCTADPEWQLGDRNFHGEDEIFGKSSLESHVFGSDGVSTVTPEEDQAWAVFATFLSSLRGMKDLEWNVPTQFPPCLLDVLHSTHPTCRLRISRFRFRSLNEPAISPHELAIAQSPVLYSIRVRYVFRDSRGQDDFNEEAVHEILRGIAPNLKQLSMVRCRPASSGALFGARGRPRGTFKGLGVTIRSPARKAGLRQLDTSISPTTMDKWARSVDFSNMESLSVGGLTLPRYIEFFGSVGGLPALRNLKISIAADPDQTHSEDMDQGPLSQQLFDSLPPLESLSFHTCTSSVLTSALQRNGTTLKNLSLNGLVCDGVVSGESGIDDVPSARRIDPSKLVQLRCVSLERLTMSLKRSLGDAVEVNVYRILGSMPCLKDLFLLLDCSNTTATFESEKMDSRWDEFDCGFFGGSTSPHRPRNGHVKEALMNCAIDEALAHSIFAVITSAKPAGSAPLQSLKIHPSGGISLGQPGFRSDHQHCVDHLQQSWLVERSPRDDTPEVIVTALGKRARETREAKYGCSIGKDMERILHRIWEFPEGGDFRRHWSSIPLQV